MEQKHDSTLWSYGKRAERMFFSTKQKIQEKMGSIERQEPDEKLAAQVAAFEITRKQQKELEKLSRKYANLTKELHDCEHQMGDLLKRMGEAEPTTTMGKCLKMNGDVFSNLAASTEPHIVATERFADSCETTFAKIVDDTQKSVEKYDSSRRESAAQQKILCKAQAGEARPERLSMIQQELDSIQHKYTSNSFDLQQKIVLMQEHRSRELSLRVSSYVETLKRLHSESAKAFAHWVPYEFRGETEAQAAVEAAASRVPPAKPGGVATTSVAAFAHPSAPPSQKQSIYAPPVHAGAASEQQFHQPTYAGAPSVESHTYAHASNLQLQKQMQHSIYADPSQLYTSEMSDASIYAKPPEPTYAPPHRQTQENFGLPVAREN